VNGGGDEAMEEGKKESKKEEKRSRKQKWVWVTGCGAAAVAQTVGSQPQGWQIGTF
jgi:hypothetical protein